MTRTKTVIREQCGTLSGYHRHSKRHEVACQPCLDANREYRRAWRTKAIPPASERTESTNDPRCGSPAGYSAHHRRGERACAGCKAAMNVKQHTYYHEGAGDDVQRRRRRTATSRRLDREGKARRAHTAKIITVCASYRPSGFWRLGSILRRLFRRGTLCGPARPSGEAEVGSAEATHSQGRRR